MSPIYKSLKFWIILLCLGIIIGLLSITFPQTAAGNESTHPPSELLVHQRLGFPGPDSEGQTSFYQGPDPDLEPGFPVQAYHGPGTYHGGVAVHTLVGNIDGDPTLEILVTALAQGPLYAWNADGSLVTGWPVSSLTGAGYMGLGELNTNQPGLEIFVGTMASSGPSGADKLAALTGGGSFLNGWPFSAANYVSSPPTLADVDADGLDEIFIGEENYYLHAYEPNGNQLPNWPKNGGGSQNRLTPAIADLDQDGDLEIVGGTGPVTSGVWIHAWHHDGTVITGWPIRYPNYGYPDTYVAIGDVDGDGDQEVIIIAKGQVQVASANGVIERTMTISAAAGGMAPALADLDGDSFPEIIIQSSNNIDIWYGDGTPFPGWPISGTGGKGNTAPVVGDIDGDYIPEIVVAKSAVRAYNLDGTLLPDFPKPLPIDAGAVPAIADIDLDGRNEIIVTGSYWNGISGNYDKVWVYDLGGPPHGPILWGQFGNNERHQGFAATTVPISGLEATNNGPVAIIETVNLTANTTAGNNLHFAWSFGDGQTGGSPNITHSYDAAGMYTAVVTASNSIGFVTATTNIVVEEAAAGLTATNDSPTVLGQATTLTATVTAGSNLAYNWDFGDGTMGGGAVVQHIYPNDGFYTATVTAANSVSQAVAETVVQVDASITGLAASNNSPTPLGQTTSFTATVTTGTNVSYIWNFGDTTTATGQVVTHTYAIPSLYTATVTATNSVDSAVTTTIVTIEQWSLYLPVILQPTSDSMANRYQQYNHFAAGMILIVLGIAWPMRRTSGVWSRRLLDKWRKGH